MLQIYVFGPVNEGFLDVDPDSVLQMESLMPQFDEDLSTGEFSLPIDIPWTDNNRKLLGFAERLENFTKKEKFWQCIVYDSGFPEIPQGKLTMLEKSGNFSYTRGKFSASVSGSKGLFGSLVKNKNLRDLRLGGIISWEDKNSREFATAVMKGEYPDYNYFAFAPVAIENFFDESRPDFTTEFLAKDMVNYLKPTGSGPNDWIFQIPDGAYMSQYQTVPFFSLKYVIKKVFEENGYKISGDFIDDPAFDDLFMFNNCSIEVFAANRMDYNRRIVPSDHLPNKTIKEFIAGVLALANVWPDFNAGVNEVRLHYKKKEIRDRRILNVDDIADRDFTSQYDEQSEDGFSIAYNWDSEDSFPSDRIKDDIEKEKTLVATVGRFIDLATLDIGRQLTTDDVAYVEAENMYYQIADATQTPLKWDAYAERMNGYKKGAGERTISLDISTLCTYVEYSPDDALFLRRDCVGCRQGGSYTNLRGVKVKKEFGLRVFYIKKLNRGGNIRPVSFNHNRDANNARIVPYSLALDGPDGLAREFHSDWEEFVGTSEIVKTHFRANQKVLHDLDINNCVERSNVLFIPYKVERSIPLGKTIEVSLMPL